ncbi:MAG: DUF2079 domain-containing protein, partial [Actinobacteria bacterium]|nr:DUF2079 domain-containing protein [Actinomycetota bacterium]
MSSSGLIASETATWALAVRERLVSKSAWVVAVWVGTALYAVLLSAESIVDHHGFRTGFDTAIYDQLLWLMAHGNEPFSTVVNRPMLADHFQPSLVLLTPLYWLGLDVPGILAVQSIGLALTAPALFALARSCGASAALASIPAFLWLVCPWVASVNLFEFRPTAFAPVLLVLSVLAARERRDVLLAVTTIFALSLKEDVSLTYVVLGLLIAYQGRRRAGAILVLGSTVWFLASSWIIQSLGGSYAAFGQRYAGERGESVGDALVRSLQHPLQTLSDVGSQSLLALVLVFLSSGGLALLAPSWMLLAAPTVVYNALSAYSPQHDLDNHYHLFTVTGLFVAVAIGVVRLPALGRHGRLVVTAGASVAVGIALLGGLRVHGSDGVDLTLESEPTQRALDRIPDDASVGAVLPMLPHLSQRVEVYTLPEPFVSLDWGSSLSATELAERAAGVRYVA